jgi:hypothetical protein
MRHWRILPLGSAARLGARPIEALRVDLRNKPAAKGL